MHIGMTFHRRMSFLKIFIQILTLGQSLDGVVSNTHDYFKKGVKSCWIVLPSLASIYVFSDPENYEIYKSTETLMDKKLDIELPLKAIFA